MKIKVILLAAIGLAPIASEGQARQMYCYANEIDISTTFMRDEGEKLSRGFSPAAQKFYVTPVFNSDDDIYLLMARYSNAAPGMGLSTCVSDEDEPDISAARQQFIDSTKSDGSSVTILPMPSGSKRPTSISKARKCSKKGQCSG